jgi:aminopeptidase YwaD
MKRSYFYFLLLFAVPVSGQIAETPSKDIESRLRTHVHLLASDSLEGREAGTCGEFMARMYIESQFREIGLLPFFSTDNYFRPFTYVDIPAYDCDNHVILNGKSLRLYHDYYALSLTGNGHVTGEAVFVGYGISAPGHGHDDYEGLHDLQGKIFIIKTSLPDRYKSKGSQLSPVEELSGRSDKVKLAIQKGASAVVFIRPEMTDNEPSLSLTFHDTPGSIPVIFLRNTELLDTFGINTLDLQVSLERSGRRTAHNVAGFIDNNAPSWVVIGAHYDHLGFSGNEGVEKNPGFEVYNGADDNASGTAAVIELARILKESGPKNNNYIFVAFSAEEKGLYGSRHFANELKQSGLNINYMLNLDMIGRMKDKKKLMLLGTGTSPAWKTTISESNTSGFRIVRIKSGLGGSDHMSFYNTGVPSIFFFTGKHRDYHRHGDDSGKLNYADMVHIVRLAENMIRHLDDKGAIEFRQTSLWSAFFGVLRMM